MKKNPHLDTQVVKLCNKGQQTMAMVQILPAT